MVARRSVRASSGAVSVYVTASSVRGSVNLTVRPVTGVISTPVAATTRASRLGLFTSDGGLLNYNDDAQVL